MMRMIFVGSCHGSSPAVLQDADLTPLWEDPAFKALVEKLRKAPK